MPLNPEDADLLKRPFGRLIPDKQVTKQNVASVLKGAKQVIAVGDATTERLVSFGITPDIAVFDGRERRSRRSYPANYPAKELRCTNPAGTISSGAVKVLQGALKTPPPVRVLVDGEEDLLALPLFAMSPESSAILYGQPLEGLVVVKITPEKQNQAKDLMDRICDNTNLLNGLATNIIKEKKKKHVTETEGRRSNNKNSSRHSAASRKPAGSAKEN